MKMKLILALLALIAVGLNLHARDISVLPAPLPELMNQEQLAQWRADREAAATKEAVATVSEPSTPWFFTGKPYVADAGGYVFKYRTYNPEMSRWTSADPSGFPDGTNNSAYAAIPTTDVDSDGRFSLSISGTNPVSPMTNGGHTATFNTITQIGPPPSSGPGSLSFTGYTFTPVSTLAGTLTVSSVTGINDGTNGGESWTATLSGAPSQTYKWIQIVTTNGSRPSHPGTLISSSPPWTTSYDNGSNTIVPFYPTGGLTTGDNSERPFGDNGQAPVYWSASMYLVSIVGTSIDIYGGFSWGYSLE